MLELTLRAFQAVKVPDGWKVEMIVADNGSSDRTAEVVDSASHSAIAIRRVFEPVSGKSRAQNTAMAHARGEVLLFTDDDVEPAENWIECMAAPLLERSCDAVAGRILLAGELWRPWLTRMHARWLAEAREPARDSPELIGASMGLHRSVFEKIGSFDEELGPGASGFGEETLLWMQMKEAGMRICPVLETHVTHRPDRSRLLRGNWLAAAVRHGASQAYIFHHWKHASMDHPALEAAWIRLKLVLRRILRGPIAADMDGCPEWEMCYVARIALLEHFRKESRKPRNYELHGLRRNPPASAGG